MCSLCCLSLLSSLVISGVSLYYQHQKNKSFEYKINELIKVNNPIKEWALHQDIDESKAPAKDDPALYHFVKHEDYFNIYSVPSGIPGCGGTPTPAAAPQ